MTVLSSASSGSTVATSLSVSPTVDTISSAFSVMLMTGITSFGLTMTVHTADSSPTVAVTVASPSPTNVRFPSSSTITTFSSLEVQMTGVSAYSGSTVAVSLPVSPTVEVISSASRTMPGSVRGAGFTITVTVVETPSHVAVMVASPGPTIVTLPFSSTTATFSLSEVQIIVLSPASAGSTVAIIVSV